MRDLPPESPAPKGNATAIAVPGGDVAALYAAVYDAHGRPRADAAITLAPGVFRLEPSGPYGGRLALGQKTILRSALRMAVDDRGVPAVNEHGKPTVLGEGAQIDGSDLAPPTTFVGEGVIVVGDQGVVRQVWVEADPASDGGLRPGIEIVARGTVRQACVRGHQIGLRVRAAGDQARGAIAGCLFAANVAGMLILSLDPDLDHPTGGNVAVAARISRTASVHNAAMNVAIIGGIGSDHNRVRVATSNSLFGGRPAEINVRVVGGQNALSPGSQHNRVTLHSAGDRFVNAAVGLQVEGGALQLVGVSGRFSLAERQSSHNRATVVLDGAAFEGNDLDVAAYGAVSRTGEMGGEANEVRVVVGHAGSQGPTIKAFDCFPEGNFASCVNTAEVG